MSITVTEYHSLFNSKQEKIKPSQINSNTELEYYTDEITHEAADTRITKVVLMAKMLKNGTIDRVPVEILNLKKKQRIQAFLDVLGDFDMSKVSKTCQAGLMFLKNMA